MADIIPIYDESEVAKPASADDLIRDANGFTNPNLHRRIHPINSLPYPYVQTIGLTWAEANARGYTWNNSAGLCKNFYDSDYYPDMMVVNDVETRVPTTWGAISQDTWQGVSVNTWDEIRWQEGEVVEDDFLSPSEFGKVITNNDAINYGRTITEINQRKNKKYSPSEYILHIQNRDSFRRKSDNYKSPDESMDSSHSEIP